MKERTYLVIDLKSFFASVECVERGLDPMTTCLVVADPDRSKNTICLAVSPALKAKGVKNRCRVMDIPDNIDYIMAPPRMQKYIDYAANIYKVYLRYVSSQDMHVYSIDEVFIDATDYLPMYGLTAKEFAIKLMEEVNNTVGVRATCGIGTNMYLAKIALDITAKHAKDFIGILDEESYKRELWDHTPLTDFWRIGNGIATRLARMGMYTMRDIANYNEDYLYKEFGIDAELIIDHAWGKEPVMIKDIKAYAPKTNCITSGQVMMRNYTSDEGKLIITEMTDQICLEMVAANLITNSISIWIGYSQNVPQPPSKGTITFDNYTNDSVKIIKKVVELYDMIIVKGRDIRRFAVSCNRVIEDTGYRQLSLLDELENHNDDKDLKLQRAMVDIKKRFGKNSILKGMNYEESATMRERNHQIGGHKSGQ